MSIPLMVVPETTATPCAQCTNEATVPEHVTIDHDGPMIVPALCDEHTRMSAYLGIFE